MGWLFRRQETGPEKGNRGVGWLRTASPHPQRALAPSGALATLLGPRDPICARPYQSWHLCLRLILRASCAPILWLRWPYSPALTLSLSPAHSSIPETLMVSSGTTVATQSPGLKGHWIFSSGPDNNSIPGVSVSLLGYHLP